MANENPEAKHPHVYGRGTTLSSAYTIGRDGKPCPPHASERTSGVYRAWRQGHAEYLAAMNENTPMMRVTCADCGAVEVLPIGKRAEVIHAILHQTGRCMRCGSSHLAFREIEEQS